MKECGFGPIAMPEKKTAAEWAEWADVALNSGIDPRIITVHLLAGILDEMRSMRDSILGVRDAIDNIEISINERR